MDGNRSLEDTYGQEFENQLIWLLLYDGNAASRLLGRIDPELLSTRAAQELIEIASAYFKKYKTPPKVSSIMTELLGRLAKTKDKSIGRKRVESVIAFLRDEVKNIPPLTGGEQKFVLDKLQDFLQRRAIYNALIDGAMNFEAGDYDQIVTDVVEAMSAGTRVAAPSLGIASYTPNSSVKDKLDRYNYRRTTATRVPVGIKHLDPLIRDGLESGTLGMFMGPPSRGKTLIMIHAGASAMALGKKVVHITLEISAVETEARYDARMTQVPINSLLKSQLPANVQKLMRKVKEIVGKGGQLYIKEYGSNEASIADLRVYLDTLQSEEGFKPDLILIDYADLLQSHHKNKEAYRFELLEIIRDLRQLARDYGCALWTASQTVKSSFDSFTISMADVAECVEKVRIADVVIGLCQTDSERQRKMMRLVLLKNRLGGHEGSVVDCFIQAETHTIAGKSLETGNAFRQRKGIDKPRRTKA